MQLHIFCTTLYCTHEPNLHAVLLLSVRPRRWAAVVVVVVGAADGLMVAVRLCGRRALTAAAPTRALDTSQWMAPLTCCEPRLSNDALLSTNDILTMVLVLVLVVLLAGLLAG